MIICEALLLTSLLTLLIISSVTDCKHSIIKNKILLIFLAVGVVVDVVYYIAFCGDCFLPFIINLLLIIVVSSFFYFYQLWAAGDSKLMFVVGILIPGRFYTFWDIGICSAFYIFVIVFAIAFLWVALESIVIGIRDKNLLKLTIGRIDIKKVLSSYLFMVAVVSLFGFLLSLLMQKLHFQSIALSTAVNFLLILTLMKIQDRLKTKWLIILTIALWSAIGILAILKIYTFGFKSDLKSWGIVLGVMLLRLLSEKYNYKTIPTKELKAGNILSAATIMQFSTSRVKGLPKGATEDLRSRITEEEAESVHRWETSVQGAPYVVIVRKIPFAIFISIGTIAFLLLEVMMI